MTPGDTSAPSRQGQGPRSMSSTSSASPADGQMAAPPQIGGSQVRLRDRVPVRHVTAATHDPQGLQFPSTLNTVIAAELSTVGTLLLQLTVRKREISFAITGV